MSTWLNCPICGSPLTVTGPALVDYLAMAHPQTFTAIQKDEGATWLVCEHEFVGTWEDLAPLAQRYSAPTIEMTGRQVEQFLPGGRVVHADVVRFVCGWRGRLLHLTWSANRVEARVNVDGLVEVLRA